MIASALPSLSVTPVASAGSGPSTGSAAGSAEPAAEGFARWLDQAIHTEDAGPGAPASPIAGPGDDKAPLDDDRGAPDAHSTATQPSPPATQERAAKLGGRSGSLPAQRPSARPGPGVEGGQPDGLRLAGVSASVDTGSALGTDRPAQTDSADPMPTGTAPLPVVPTVDVSALLAAWNGGAVPVDAALAQALAAGNGNAADPAAGGAPPAASAAARAGVATRLGGSPRASDPTGGTPAARRGRAAADEPAASAAGEPGRAATAEAQVAAGDASTAEAAANTAQAATAAVALASPAARPATAAGAPAAGTAAAAGAADSRTTPGVALAPVGPRAPATLPAATQGPTAAPDTTAGPTAQSAAASLSTTPTAASSTATAVGATWGPVPTAPSSITPPTASATPLSTAAVAGAVDPAGADAAGKPAAMRLAAAPGGPSPATEPADALQRRLATAPATASSVIDAAARASDRLTGDAPWAAEAAPSTRRTVSDVDGPTPTPTDAVRTAAHAVSLGGPAAPAATDDSGPSSRADGAAALQTEARTGALTQSAGDRRAVVAEPVGPASVAAGASAAALSSRDTGSIRQRDSGSENGGSAANIGASSGAPWNGALAWVSGATAGMTAATERATDGRIMDSPGSTGFAPQLAAHITTLVRDGVQQARLELNPAEMGPLTVQIQLDGNAARVHLAAEHAQTRAALEQAMPQLAGSLRENGLTLSGGGVFEQPRQSQPSQTGTGTGSGDGGSQANGGGQNGRGTHAGRDSANPQPPGTNATTGRRRSGVVDLVA